MTWTFSSFSLRPAAGFYIQVFIPSQPRLPETYHSTTYLFVRFHNPLSQFASVLQKTTALPSVREAERLQDSVSEAWPNTASLTSRLLISSCCRIGGCWSDAASASAKAFMFLRLISRKLSVEHKGMDWSDSFHRRRGRRLLAVWVSSETWRNKRLLRVNGRFVVRCHLILELLTTTVQLNSHREPSKQAHCPPPQSLWLVLQIVFASLSEMYRRFKWCRNYLLHYLIS